MMCIIIVDADFGFDPLRRETTKKESKQTSIGGPPSVWQGARLRREGIYAREEAQKRQASSKRCPEMELTREKARADG